MSNAPLPPPSPGEQRSGAPQAPLPQPPVAPGAQPAAATQESLPQPPAAQVCPRHPDREAGRRCTRCGRPACTQCLTQADIGSICVDCAKLARPTTRERANLWNARQPVLVTYVLMGLNLAVFVWMGVRDTNNLAGDRITIETLQLGLRKLLLDESVFGSFGQAEWNQFQLIDGFPWYRLVSSGFMHFGIIHLIFNMFLLFQLGNMLEPALGRVRFALVYVAGLLGGSFGILVLQPDGLHGGASGAVFGLIGAAAAGMLRRGINPLTTSIGSLLMINLFMTFAYPGISVGGHIGGVIGGGIAGYLAFGLTGGLGGRRRPATEASRLVAYAGPALVSVLAVAGCVLLV